MNFLDWPIEQRSLSKRMEHHRKATTLRLIGRFSAAFPEIEYDLLWDSPVVNAQAWRLGSGQHVTICGGLARQPLITASGLALILAHETGHHMGGLPRDPDLRWPTWQGQADYWAASVGMPRVFGFAAEILTLQGAKQIEALHEVLLESDGEPDVPPETRTAIFQAGAVGKDISGLLDAAFAQMMAERAS